MTVAFMANLIQSSGMNQMMFHTQTIPIQPPEIPLISVKPQLANAAMMDEMTCATTNAPMSAYDGRSMKKNPCERVTKISACEIMAT